MSQEQQFTPREVARLKGWTIGYVYTQLWTGRLSGTQIGKRWLIDAVALEQRPCRRSRKHSERA